MGITEEMDMADVGPRGKGRWEPRLSCRLEFMVSKAADPAISGDLRDIPLPNIRPPMYIQNPINLD